MFTQYEIGSSKHYREEVARQVENNRLARQLRAVRLGMATGNRDALLGRIFAWSPRGKQTVEC